MPTMHEIFVQDTSVNTTGKSSAFTGLTFSGDSETLDDKSNKLYNAL